MITGWLTHDGDWKSLTANERIPRAGGNQRRLNSHQVNRWWRDELALVASPCFDVAALADGSLKRRTLFTIFSITDRMHRPQ